MSENAPLRPSADSFLQLIRQQQKGKLKVYIGASPGVGKTFSMLQEGNRLKKRGVDVVIGYVEPHDRPETMAQVGELEIVPSREIRHQGIVLYEMDVDAVIARKPIVALVDELAHTNAPGSKNRKRYEDVEDLLRAGISVITTVNVQHFESLYNIVEQATGVKVKERIPDEIVANADQIVNVDLPAEDLLERLEAGKIYPQERIQRAMANFFTGRNLTSLREMTLSEVANFLDRRQRDTFPADIGTNTGMGQVMVALSSGGPEPGRLLRKAARLAAQLNAQWYAVYVRTTAESAVRISSDRQRQINDILESAQRMGGIVITLKNDNIPQALVAFAKEYGITHVVVGRPGQRSWMKRLTPSLLDMLLEQLPDVDVVVG